MTKVVVITGAGSGLGSALAKNATLRGYKVFGIGRRADTLAMTGRNLNSSLYHPVVADVSEHSKIEDAIANIIDKEGQIHAIFANAAVYPRLPFVDQSISDFMKILAINVGGVMALCRSALIPMMQQAYGRVVIVGSFADRSPIVNSLSYSVSKGALHSLTKALATEVGSDYPNILINEWVPGVLNTDMGLAEGIDPMEAANWGLDLIDLHPGGPSGEIFFQNKMEVQPLRLKEKVKRSLLLDRFF